MSVIPRIISVDDHVIEPADVWTSRLPAAYVERAPRIHIARTPSDIFQALLGQDRPHVVDVETKFSGGQALALA